MGGENKIKTSILNRKRSAPLNMITFDYLNLTNLQEFIEPRTASIMIDMRKIGLNIDHIVDEKFLFSPSTTSITEVEKEIEEIEDDEYRYSSWRNTQVLLALGGSALGMWFAFKGLTALEKWMKEQEQKDIEEEIQMTGTYINPGAEKVEASIDPKTGKRIQIKEEDSENKKDGKSE